MITSTKKSSVIKMAWGLLAVLLFATAGGSYAATAEDLNVDANLALETLYSTHPVALELSENAKAILVFPNVIKAGLVFGGSYGEGVLFKDGNAVDYYNSVMGSWGLQAGQQGLMLGVSIEGTKISPIKR